MATKRRSVRGNKSNVTYKNESSEESEEEIDPKIKKAKIKLKPFENVNDSGYFDHAFKRNGKKSLGGSSGDYIEEVATTSKTIKPKSTLASRVKKLSTKKQLSKNNLTSPSKTISLFQKVQMPRNNLELEKISLSESDSSGDELNEKRQIIKSDDKTPFKSIYFSHTANNTSDDDDIVASDKLLALAGNLDKINNAWKEEPKHHLQANEVPSTSKIKNHEKEICEDDFDISKLLAEGEGVAGADQSSDDDDIEDVVKNPVKPQDSIQINISLPESGKRKKKGFDMAAFLKREIAKGRRELQLLLHQCHYLCLVANLRYLSLALQDPVLQSVGLSLVPPTHCHAPSSLTLPRLQSLVSWLRDALPVTKENEGALAAPLQSSLLKKLEHFVVSNEVEMVLVFVLICRALGFDTRLVVNFAVVSLKPTTVEEDINVETPRKEEKSRDKSKKNNSSKPCSDDEGEEFSNQKPKSLSSKLAAAAQRRASCFNHENKSKANSQQREDDLIHKGESREEFNQKTMDKLTKKRSKNKDKPGESNRKATAKKEIKDFKPGLDYWCEVFVAGKWVTVDIVNGRSNCGGEMEERATKPVTYVLADNGFGVKDVTGRYASNYMTHTRKLRCPQHFLDDSLRAIKTPRDDKDLKEDRDIERRLEEAPMPITVQGFKDHPLYVLKRHLLKFEAIYPPNSLTLGFIKSEAVYARECVHTLQGRTAWLKEGRTVKLHQEPYKVVKARPKWDRMTGNKVTDEPLDLFGLWQTELYVPKAAENGLVPRNEYGNVELFKPWMLPIGCVHLPINTLRGTARRLGIDAVPAMVGWDFSGGGAHPVYDGYVVVEDRAEELMEVWNKEQEDREVKVKEKREARVLANWKRMVKGMMIKQRIRDKYLNKQ